MTEIVEARLDKNYGIIRLPGEVTFAVYWHHCGTINSIGTYPTLSAAKEAANEHNRQRIAERYLEVVR
jgi:hypothetical protein